VATTNTVAQVPLTAVARIVKRTAPLVITHQGQFPSATISFNLRERRLAGRRGDGGRGGRAGYRHAGAGISGSYAGDAAEFQRSLAASPG
jgi:multidrug efflux pump